MKKENTFYPHTAALGALFFLGNGIIYLPDVSANEYTLLAFLVCSAAFLILLSALLPAITAVFCGSPRRLPARLITAVILLLTAVLSLHCLSSAFTSFTDLACKVMLKPTLKPLVIITFSAVCLFFIFKRPESLLKFSLTAFCFTAALVLFFFLASIGNYSLKSIFIFEFPNFNLLLHQARSYVLNPFAEALLIPVYTALAFGKIKKSPLFAGVGTGLILFILCLSGPLLLFGASLSGKLDFPYSSAISTVSFGTLFTRMDGLSYFIYSICVIVKISTSAFICFACLKKLSLAVYDIDKQHPKIH